MFGYIIPLERHMSSEEKETFKQCYCGLCRSIKEFGQVPRFFLSYDFVFLSILLSSISKETITIDEKACLPHPFKKREYIVNNATQEYCAGMNVMLGYLNLLDKKKDKQGKDLMIPTVAFVKGFKKTLVSYPEKYRVIETELSNLEILEKEKCNSIDQASEPFAKIMEELFCYGNSSNYKVLGWMGFNIGKWLYLIDAYDDIEEDMNGKRYNPIIYANPEVKDPKILRDTVKTKIEMILVTCIRQVQNAYDLLDVKVNKGILDNIMCMGLLARTDYILNNREEKDEQPI